MSLYKKLITFQSRLLLNAKDLSSTALRYGHSKSSTKKCFKFRPTKIEKKDCKPVPKPVPRFYRQLDPCKTDKELSVQHPKYLGSFGRCHIPYKPECMPPCAMVERFDDTMYKPSASLDRKFERYWVECSIGKRKRCCRRVPPERSVRTPGRCTKQRSSCPPTLYPMPCRMKVQAKSACEKVTVCDCPPLYNTKVTCRLGARPKRCRRPQTMYPSFSECQHEELNLGRPIECLCLKSANVCDMFKYQDMKRRGPCDKVNLGDDYCNE